MNDSLIDLDILVAGYPALKLFKNYPTELVHDVLSKIIRYELNELLTDRVSRYHEQAKKIFSTKRLELLNNETVIEDWVEYMSIYRALDWAIVSMKIEDQAFVRNHVEIVSEVPYDNLLRNSNGNVLVAPHLGAYQAIPQILGGFGYKIASFMDAAAIPLWDELGTHYCPYSYEHVRLLGLPSQSATRTAIKELRSGSNLILYPEFSLGVSASEQDTLPFLGEEIYRVTGPSRIAHMTKKPIVPIHILKMSDYNYTLYVGHPIEVGDTESDVSDVTNQLTYWMENLIKEFPSQWWAWNIFDSLMVKQRSLV